jgi:glutathione synthase/RimK-type ligase-like ATP-grasp enzyme
MNVNLQCLLAACELEGRAYRVSHRSQNVVAVGRHYFVNWSVPLLPYSLGRLCTDKDYTYQVFHGCVRMPRSHSFLSPFVATDYQQYLEYSTLDAIVAAGLAWGPLPVVLKPNGGSHGTNVYLCTTSDQLRSGFASIFDTASKDYDYVAVIQSYVKPEREARVIFVDGQVSFGYWKSLKDAKFVGNLSPLHWEGSRAVPCTEVELQRLASFMSPVFAECPDLRYVGVDIIEDEQGELWLIELNCSPGFAIFVRDNGRGAVIKMFREVLTSLDRS